VATLKLKTADFRSISRRRTLAVPTQTAKALFAVARELLAGEVRGSSYRLIGAGLSDFVDAAEGLDLFADAERRARSSESAIDALKKRFGAGAVVTGRALKKDR
jgi:DNA polymerase-4